MKRTIAGMFFAALIFLSPSEWTRGQGLHSLNPVTYSSLSGEFSLFVNPTDLYGRGPADYSFTKNGAAAWKKQLPFTLYNAVVADSGHVIGYAYTNGLEAFSKTGDFVVVILSEKGEFIHNETHPREGSRFLHAEPNPVAAGIVMDGMGKHVILRVSDPDLNRRTEKWWVYDLESGKRLDDIEPEKPTIRGDVIPSIVSVKAVPGTPLALMQWREANLATPQAFYALVDPKGKIIWNIKAGYGLPSQEQNRDETERILRENGVTVDAWKAGVFNLLFMVDELRVSYAVMEQSPGKWEVKKIGQSPFAPLKLNQSAQLPAFPALNLKELGTTNLSTAIDQKTGPINGIVSFEFDPSGTICALGIEKDAVPRLLYLSQEGEILKELPLPIQKLPRYSNPANVGAGRFVVSVSGQGVGSVAQWFLADFQSGTIKKIDNDECPTVNKAAGLADGRFAALTTRNGKYAMTSGLFIFDPNGKIVWKKEEAGYSRKPEDLLSPEDIAPYGADSFAVLDKIRHTIQLFDAKGSFIRIIDLNDARGRRPNYPINLAPDRNEGFLVYDFMAPKTLVRINKDGKILAESVPKLADGSPFRVVGGIKRSPQGDLWTSDGNALFRLGDDSTVNFTLGQEPKTSNLSNPGYVEIGPDDRIYIGDQRTKNVHVFDSSSRVIGRYSPKAEDLKETSDVQHIAVSKEGDVYISLDLSGVKYLHFQKDITREGWLQQIDADKIKQEWYFQPSSDLCWIMGYQNVFLLQNLNKVVNTISRRADGKWLEYTKRAAVAADGSLAVLAGTQPVISGTYSINIYSSSGEARKTFDLPFSPLIYGNIAYDGHHVFIRFEGDLFVFSAEGKPLGKFTLPLEGNTEWNGPWLAMQGKELWFVEKPGMKLHRYAIPKKF